METFFEQLKKFPDSIYDREYSEAHTPDIVKLFKLYSHMFDRLKFVLDDLAVLKDLSTQKGEILDEIGRIVKEPRSGRSDDIYRTFLYIAIQRNISNGSLRKVADITRLIIGESADYTISEEFPTTLLDSDNEDPDPEVLLDGTWILNPYIQMPATFSLDVTGISGELAIYLEEAVSEVKAVGIKAIVNME